jgi:phage baseplate assembly protein W
MSKSLALVNGDLVISNRSLKTLRGKDKLFQDLSLYLLEKVGTDSMTPTYGSTLDGGYLDGQEIPPFIGRTLNPLVEGQIQAEVYRVVLSYQLGQLDKIKSEASIYQGKNTLDPDEVIQSIDSITTTTVGTTVVVNIQVTTMSASQVSLILPITNLY